MLGHIEAYHEAKMAPLEQEVPIDVDAVRLAQVLGDQRPDGWQVLLLEAMFVLDIAQLGWQFSQTRSLFHLINSCHKWGERSPEQGKMRQYLSSEEVGGVGGLSSTVLDLDLRE